MAPQAASHTPSATISTVIPAIPTTIPTTLQITAQTDVGRKRDHNEDFVLSDPALGLYMVCDGMGGHAAGEVASQHACHTVQRILRENKSILASAALSENQEMRDRLAMLIEGAVNLAGMEIFQIAKDDTSKSGMGTTLALLVVTGNKGIVAHVGDSRIYVSRDGHLHQLTEDHSYCNEMVKRGKMTREEARNSVYANVITRAVGVQSNVQVDTAQVDVNPDDIFLLCSDGMHGYIEDPSELADFFENHKANTLEETAQDLINIANERGGKDNISVLLLRSQANQNHVAGESNHEINRETAGQIEILRKTALFRHLSESEFLKVLSATRTEKIARGTVLMHEGDENDEMYMILSGAVSVRRNNQEIVELKAGSLFGEMSLVDDKARSALVQTKENCKFLVLDRRNFYRLVRKDPALSVKILWSFVQLLSRRLRETNAQLAEVLEVQENAPDIFGKS